MNKLHHYYIIIVRELLIHFWIRCSTKFNILIKIFINQGLEFHEEFEELFKKTIINHHMISRDHFEVDNLLKGWSILEIKIYSYHGYDGVYVLLMGFSCVVI